MRGCSLKHFQILTLSHPSNAQSPAYKATAHRDGSLFVPSNHPCVFQSSLGSPLHENPVNATTMPKTVTPINAMNLKIIKTSADLVAILVEMELRNVTRSRPPSATPLFIQMLASAASGPMTARTMYSPKIMAIIAADPGLSTQTVHQLYRKPTSGPNILAR